MASGIDKIIKLIKVRLAHTGTRKLSNSIYERGEDYHMIIRNYKGLVKIDIKHKLENVESFIVSPLMDDNKLNGVLDDISNKFLKLSK